MNSGGFSFLRANVFDNLDDNIKENHHKGMKVTLSGEIVTGSCTRRESGRKIYITEVNANWLELDQKQAGGPNSMPEGEGLFMKILPEQLDEMPFR